MKLIDFIVCYRMAPLQMLHFVTLTCIFRVKIQMITKLSKQMCFYLYGTHRRVARLELPATSVLLDISVVPFSDPPVNDSISRMSFNNCELCTKFTNYNSGQLFYQNFFLWNDARLPAVHQICRGHRGWRRTCFECCRRQQMARRWRSRRAETLSEDPAPGRKSHGDSIS